MKRLLNLPLRLAISAGLIACAGPALADTATLTINGKVLPGTCVLDISAVKLPDLNAADVKEGDLKMTDAAVNFKNCVAIKKINLEFTGAAADADAEHWKNTAPGDGAAQGLAVVLKDGAKFDVNLKNGDKRSLAASATNSYPFKVGYHHAKNAEFSSGNVVASITVKATYE